MILDASETSTQQWLEYNSATRHTPTGWTYNCIEQFVLLNGQPFPERTPKKVKLGGIGQCFRNAIKLAKRQNLIYCEGYAKWTRTSFAFQHGWCVDQQGVVFDPTWRDGFDYFGIALDLEYAIKRRKESDWQSVLDSPPEFPVISGLTDEWRYKGAIGVIVSPTTECL